MQRDWASSYQYHSVNNNPGGDGAAEENHVVPREFPISALSTETGLLRVEHIEF